jgi:hypothetical protein
MEAGRTYQIDLRSTWDNYLFLEDERGNVLRWDDDSGGNLNAQIIHAAAQAGNYRIIVTSCNGRQTGPYTLTVREF